MSDGKKGGGHREKGGHDDEHDHEDGHHEGGGHDDEEHHHDHRHDDEEHDHDDDRHGDDDDEKDDDRHGDKHDHEGHGHHGGKHGHKDGGHHHDKHDREDDESGHHEHSDHSGSCDEHNPPPCFVKGTLIETPGGAMPVERLGAGDRVICADGSVLPILWAGGRVLDEAELQARPQLRPVVFRFGSLGNRRELRLSPQHAVALHTVEGTRLARAIHLARRGDGAFRVAQGVKSVSYHHLLLPRHALLLAEGAVVESMWPGPIPMAAVGVENRADILRCAPRLKPALDGDAAVESLYGPRAAPVLSGREVKAMARIEAPQRRRLQQAA